MIMDEEYPLSRVWNAPVKFFHWLVALLIVAAIITGMVAEELPLSPAKLQLFILHKSLGITVLWLFFLRLSWRIASGSPGHASRISSLNARLAEIGHWALYGFMLLLPLSGWILNSAADFPFRWFGWFAVPSLTQPDEQLKDISETIHVLLAYGLIAALVGHAAMALKHHLHGSDVLIRMWPSTGVMRAAFLLGLLTIIAGVAYMASVSSESGNSGVLAESSSVNPAAGPAAYAESEGHSEADAQLSAPWLMDLEASQLTFEATYDEVPFEGQFSSFDTDIRFDPDALSTSRIAATITLLSVNTGSEERDDMLPGEDWFSVDRFPVATYSAERIQQQENGQYAATGELSLKGISHPVTLEFSWTQEGGTAQLTGKAVLDRRAFGVGSGMWAEDATIGYQVLVKVNLHLQEIKPTSQ